MKNYLRKINFNIFLFSTLLLLLPLVSPFSTVSFISEPYFPPEGTLSTYLWDFTGFPAISTMNSNFNDSTTLGDTIHTINPTKAEFSIRFVSFEDFLVEEVNGVMYNVTGGQEFRVTRLLNKTTREYLDSSGGVVGYVDPFVLEKGSQIDISGVLVTVTTKENVTIFDQDRESWKLEYISEWMNQTFHYDVETGILLNARIETTEEFIGSGAEVGDIKDEIICYQQKIISTNAFYLPTTTFTSSFGALTFLITAIGCATIIQRRKNNFT